MTVADGSAVTVASSFGSVPASQVRAPTTSATSSCGRRASKKLRYCSDGTSAHCASSMTTSVGVTAATFTSNQWRPCKTAKDGSTRGDGMSPAAVAPGRPRNAAAIAASPCRSSERSNSSASTRIGSNSCRTTPYANVLSSCEPRACTTRMLRPAAAWRAAASSAVLPIPDGPSTTTSLPLPRHASASAESMRSSSSVRSSKTSDRGARARAGPARCA